MIDFAYYIELYSEELDLIILTSYLFQDLQNGLDLGVVSPEVLQNFFDLEQYPFVSELTDRFQVCYDKHLF